MAISDKTSFSQVECYTCSSLRGTAAPQPLYGLVTPCSKQPLRQSWKPAQALSPELIHVAEAKSSYKSWDFSCFFFLFFQLDRPRLLPVWVFLTTLWRLWWLCFCLSGHYPASTEARNSWTTAFVRTPRQSLEQRTSTDHGYPEFIFRPGHCKSTLQFASPECWECPPSTIQINTMRMHSRGQSCLHLTPDIQACTSAAFMFPPPQLEIRFLDVQMSGFLQIAGFPLSCLFASDPVVSKRVRVAAEVVCLSGSQRTEA